MTKIVTVKYIVVSQNGLLFVITLVSFVNIHDIKIKTDTIIPCYYFPHYHLHFVFCFVLHYAKTQYCFL